jgi:hypothetical protein
MTVSTGILGRAVVIAALVFSFGVSAVVFVDSVWKAATPYAYDGSHRGLVEHVKERMHDPDSFQHVHTHVVEGEEGNLLIVMKYRAANGFGALRLATIGAIVYADGRILAFDESDVLDWAEKRND